MDTPRVVALSFNTSISEKISEKPARGPDSPLDTAYQDECFLLVSSTSLSLPEVHKHLFLVNKSYHIPQYKRVLFTYWD